MTVHGNGPADELLRYGGIHYAPRTLEIGYVPLLLQTVFAVQNTERVSVVDDETVFLFSDLYRLGLAPVIHILECDGDLHTHPLRIKGHTLRHSVLGEVPGDRIVAVLVPSAEHIPFADRVRRGGYGRPSILLRHIEDGTGTVTVVECDREGVSGIQCQILCQRGLEIIGVVELVVDIPADEIITGGRTFRRRHPVSVFEHILDRVTLLIVDERHLDVFEDGHVHCYCESILCIILGLQNDTQYVRLCTRRIETLDGELHVRYEPSLQDTYLGGSRISRGECRTRGYHDPPVSIVQILGRGYGYAVIPSGRGRHADDTDGGPRIRRLGRDLDIRASGTTGRTDRDLHVVHVSRTLGVQVDPDLGIVGYDVRSLGRIRRDLVLYLGDLLEVQKHISNILGLVLYGTGEFDIQFGRPVECSAFAVPCRDVCVGIVCGEIHAATVIQKHLVGGDASVGTYEQLELIDACRPIFPYERIGVRTGLDVDPSGVPHAGSPEEFRHIELRTARCADGGSASRVHERHRSTETHRT